MLLFILHKYRTVLLWEHVKVCQSAKMERVKKRSEIGGGKMGEYRKKYDEDFKKLAAKNLPNH